MFSEIANTYYDKGRKYTDADVKKYENYVLDEKKEGFDSKYMSYILPKVGYKTFNISSSKREIVLDCYAKKDIMSKDYLYKLNNMESHTGKPFIYEKYRYYDNPEKIIENPHTVWIAEIFVYETIQPVKKCFLCFSKIDTYNRCKHQNLFAKSYKINKGYTGKFNYLGKTYEFEDGVCSIYKKKKSHLVFDLSSDSDDFELFHPKQRLSSKFSSIDDLPSLYDPLWGR